MAEVTNCINLFIVDVSRTLPNSAERKLIDSERCEPQFPHSMLSGGGLSVLFYASVANQAAFERSNNFTDLYFEGTD
jgi:hypothetical protein